MEYISPVFLSVSTHLQVVSRWDLLLLICIWQEWPLQAICYLLESSQQTSWIHWRHALMDKYPVQQDAESCFLRVANRLWLVVKNNNVISFHQPIRLTLEKQENVPEWPVWRKTEMTATAKMHNRRPAIWKRYWTVQKDFPSSSDNTANSSSFYIIRLRFVITSFSFSSSRWSYSIT